MSFEELWESHPLLQDIRSSYEFELCQDFYEAGAREAAAKYQALAKEVFKVADQELEITLTDDDTVQSFGGQTFPEMTRAVAAALREEKR